MSKALAIRTALLAPSLALAAAYALPASAHHSFAAYDITRSVEVAGTVATLKFRNPHIEMTLELRNKDGKAEIVHFVDGAPANMLVRMGLEPDLIKPGTKITAIGSPRKDTPTEYFLKTIILADGRKFESLKK
jgi:hypothetical protein